MRWLGVLLAVLLLSGCSWFRSKPAGSNQNQTASNAKGKRLIVTPDTAQVGRVVQVNLQGRFAIMNFPVGEVPPIERQLNVYRNGLKVGEIRVSGPQSDDNTVGDIIAGEASVGDEVRVN